MNTKLELFDKDGNKLKITNVLIDFFIEKSKEHNLGVSEMAIYCVDDWIELAMIDYSDNYSHFKDLEVSKYDRG